MAVGAEGATVAVELGVTVVMGLPLFATETLGATEASTRGRAGSEVPQATTQAEIRTAAVRTVAAYGGVPRRSIRDSVRIKPHF